MASLRPLAWLVSLVLAGAVSYSAAALSMQVLEQRLDATAPLVVAAPPPATTQAQREKLPLAEFQPVLTANIFGARRTEVKPAAAVTGPDGAQASAPVVKAPLAVTLTGTMIMGNRAFAMIADGNGRNEKVYRLYDCLPAAEDHPTRNCSPTQGKLVSVQKKKVLVTYQGDRLSFELAARPAPAATAPVATNRPAAIRRGVADAAAPPPAADTPAAPFPITQEGSLLQVRVPSAEVSKAFENFSDVLKEARVVPYTDANGTGFQIRNIRPGSIFDRIGLSNFDKIKAVNGDPITTADQALRLLTMFRNERELTLDLERKEQSLQLNYIIE